MSAAPVISVVTPALNPGEHLARALETLNAQDMSNFEWVLVDDGSAAEQANAFADAERDAHFPVHRVRLDKTCGQAHARNVGVTAARGRFVKFLDVDDGLDPPHLRNLLTAAERCGGSKTIPFAPTKHHYVATSAHHHNRSYLQVGREPDQQLASLLRRPFLTHCGALFSRSLLIALGPYDATLKTDEDGDLLIRVLLDGWRFEAVPASTYIYRHAGRSRVSNDDACEKLLSRRSVCEKLVAWYQQRGQPMPETIRDALAQRLDAIAMRAWNEHPSLAQELLADASALRPNYTRSGSLAERSLRGLFGEGPALRLMALTRYARGRTTG